LGSRRRREMSVSGSVLERCGEAGRVGHVGRVEDVVVELAHALGQGGRRGEHQVGTRGEARLGLAERLSPHALLRGDVVHAVVDDPDGLERVDQPLRLRHVAPQQRPLHTELAHGAPDLEAKQPGVQARDATPPVEGDHQRREHVQPVDRARPGERLAQAARHPGEVRAREARPAQPERLQEQHPVVLGQPRHQVLLVGPQLRVPLPEAEADDRTPLDLHRVALRTSRSASAGSVLGSSGP
jgi:hypothetical protein